MFEYDLIDIKENTKFLDEKEHNGFASHDTWDLDLHLMADNELLQKNTLEAVSNGLDSFIIFAMDFIYEYNLYYMVEYNEIYFEYLKIDFVGLYNHYLEYYKDSLSDL